MKILIFGATSALAKATADNFAMNGNELFLVASNHDKLKIVSDDLVTRFGAKVHNLTMNALEFKNHEMMINKAIVAMNGLDIFLVAHGTLPDQLETQRSAEETVQEFNVNCTSVISMVTIAANYFESKQAGTIAVISSVAGDRGRQSNYIYGSSKGAVSLFLQGLRNRLAKKNVKVITIKPGMVATPMTIHLPKSPLFAHSHTVGLGIYEAIIKGKDIAYIPGYWRFIMLIIKLIPESIFKKLNL